jgi:hypothetical protein
VFIAKNVKSHVLQEETHVFPLPSFQSSCRPHSTILGIVAGFFLWGGHVFNGSNEEITLSQLLPNGCVSPSCHRGFWMPSPIGQQVSLSMC